MNPDPLQKFTDILAEHLGVERGDITEASSIIEDLDADSLDIVELQMAVEEEWGIQIPDENVDKFNTVADWIEYIGGAIAKQ